MRYTKMFSCLLLAVVTVCVQTGCDKSKTASAPPSAQTSPQPQTPQTPAPQAAAPQPAPVSLREARRGFNTHLTKRIVSSNNLPHPPPNVFSVVQYESPVGMLAAYLTPDPADGARHPAIIWITGGDSNSIGNVWSAYPADNEQSASAYRKAGIVMMFPSLRGGNDNPGQQEKFFGEVDDILAAADFLARQTFVDPARIYLGGHSTGGTLVLLVAEYSDRFRAVFSFGAVDDIRRYGTANPLPFDTHDAREFNLRRPIAWLGSIHSPTFVLEGDVTPSNLISLSAMAAARPAPPPSVRFIPVHGASHFTILAPVNHLIAEKILNDKGPQTNITISSDELSPLFQ